MELTISKEDYLKAIAEAESEEGPVIAATLARWLKVSPPAVALALRRLKRDRWVTTGAAGRIRLTPAGRAIANRLRRRHHLVERMLHEMLGVEWYRVHEEAERLEHAISEQVEKRLAERLGGDGPCPHGNFINKSPAQRRRMGLQLLAEAPEGEALRVEGMHERDAGLLEYFHRLGIHPGQGLQVVRRNYDGTLNLRLGSAAATLGDSAARRLWVAKAK
ncbi:MAG: metal-dependent transcriptional regulator [Terriglobales bacterium]